jgi:hypothetical protein
VSPLRARRSYLIDGNPVLHTVSQSFEKDTRERHKVLDNLLRQESSVTGLEFRRVVPMIDGHARCDTLGKQRIDLVVQPEPSSVLY